MPEENEKTPDPNNGGGEGFTPITSQDQLDKIIGGRIQAVKAKFADYDDVKAKAAKYDKTVEESKTELQKVTDRATAAEKRIAEFEMAEKKRAIAEEFDVIPEVVHGATEDEMRATAKRAAEWRGDAKKPAPKPRTLQSGAGGTKPEGGRAAAALRELRRG